MRIKSDDIQSIWSSAWHTVSVHASYNMLLLSFIRASIQIHGGWRDRGRDLDKGGGWDHITGMFVYSQEATGMGCRTQHSRRGRSRVSRAPVPTAFPPAVREMKLVLPQGQQLKQNSQKIQARPQSH